MLKRQLCVILQERKKLKVIRFLSLESYSASCTSREVVLFVRPRLFRTRIIAAISTNAMIPSEPTSKPANRNHWGLSSVESFDKGASKAVEKRKFVLWRIVRDQSLSGVETTHSGGSGTNPDPTPALCGLSLLGSFFSYSSDTTEFGSTCFPMWPGLVLG